MSLYNRQSWFHANSKTLSLKFTCLTLQTLTNEKLLPSQLNHFHEIFCSPKTLSRATGIVSLTNFFLFIILSSHLNCFHVIFSKTFHTWFEPANWDFWQTGNTFILQMALYFAWIHCTLQFWSGKFTLSWKILKFSLRNSDLFSVARSILLKIPNFGFKNHKNPHNFGPKITEKSPDIWENLAT